MAERSEVGWWRHLVAQTSVCVLREPQTKVCATEETNVRLREGSSEVAPISRVTRADLRAELFRSTARGPVVIQHQRVAQIFRASADQFEIRIRGHREVHPAAARRFMHPDAEPVELLRLADRASRREDCPIAR